MYMYYIFIDSCKDVVSAADDGRDTSRTRNHDLYSTSNFHVSREYVRPACTKTCTYTTQRFEFDIVFHTRILALNCPENA